MGITDEEAELLAELRAISNKCGGSSRFNDDGNGMNDGSNESLSSKSKQDSNTENIVNPKLRGTKVSENAPQQITKEQPMSSAPSAVRQDVMKQDHEHLSTKERTVVTPSKNLKNRSPEKLESDEVPPWRRSKSVSKQKSTDSTHSPRQKDDDTHQNETKSLVHNTNEFSSKPKELLKDESFSKTVDAPIKSQAKAPRGSSSPSQLPGHTTAKQSTTFSSAKLPKTFSGDRGGAAEDAELLELLKAVSSKSGGSHRFDDNTSDSKDPVPKQNDLAKKQQPSSSSSSKVQETMKENHGPNINTNSHNHRPNNDSTVVTRRRSAEQPDPTELGTSDTSQYRKQAQMSLNVVSENSMDPHISSSNLIRSVPMNHDDVVSLKTDHATRITSPTLSNDIDLNASPTSMDKTASVTKDDLPGALTSKDWKIRKAAFELLTSILTDLIQQQSKLSSDESEATFISINDNHVLVDLEEHVVSMANDTNAGALDAALTFLVLYADTCKSATRPEQASGLATQLLNKGTAFSSTRPSTSKLVRDLFLKLMEVGKDGRASVHAVVNVLIADGVSSKKPKVVTAAVALIVDALKAFGASSLPVSSLSKILPTLLGHANGIVREQGLIILVELCRTLGSKVHLQSVIDNIKPTLVSQLDDMLLEQIQPSPPAIGLRSQRITHDNVSGTEGLNGYHPNSPSSSMQAELAAAEKESQAEKFAARVRINVLEELKKTEYSDKIKLAKWSEKAEALDMLVKCGGERPFKLSEPSATVNYAPLIHELKLLLSHTHFAVNIKALAALGMLAEGVGEKLFPNLRPLLPLLLGLSRDKKLIIAAASCLDSFYGRVLTLDHIVEEEDAVPTSVNESLEKNALVRKTCLEYLQRCIERQNDANLRLSVSSKAASIVTNLACSKLQDADALVRKAAMELLQTMLDSQDQDIATMSKNKTKELEKSNPRAYKCLKIIDSESSTGTLKASTEVCKKREPVIPSGTVGDDKEELWPKAQAPGRSSILRSSVLKKEPSMLPKASKRESSDIGQSSELDDNTLDLPSLADALSVLATFDIEKWNAAEDDGGILAGLSSSTWQLRRDAILNLAEFTGTDQARLLGEQYIINTLVLVRDKTKGFKESNFNLAKAIMEFLIAVCDYYAGLRKPIDVWLCKAASSLALDKLGDKKFSGVAQPLLIALCVVRDPNQVLNICFNFLESIKSPGVHEEFMIWCKSFCDSFGLMVLGSRVSDLVSAALKECENANIKVRTAALSLIGEMYKQLGPTLKALVLANSIPDSLKSQVDSIFSTLTYNPKLMDVPRAKLCVVLACKGLVGGQGNPGGKPDNSLKLEVPRTDLFNTLSNDCISRLGSKEGKNAWKVRKEALEEVESGLQRCGGFVSTDPVAFKGLLDLARSLRERLNDSQMNLKPIAAKIIATLLSSVDEDSQAKLGRIFFAPLINAAINDNKKVMRDSALEVLEAGTTKPEIEGGGVNAMSVEVFLQALILELNESEYKAGGLPDVLQFALERAQYFPKTGSSRIQGLENQFAAAIVPCLTSAKSETRSSAEALMRICVENGSLSLACIDKGVKLLLPAQQRTISHIITSLSPAPVFAAGKDDMSITSSSKKSIQIRPKSNSRPGRESSLCQGKIDSGRESLLMKNTENTDSVRSSSRVRTRLPSSRDSLSSSKRNQEYDVTPISLLLDDAQFNPLKGLSPGSNSKIQRCSNLARQRENWPEYPEEPTGTIALTTLKKKWSQLIPSHSVEIFFPATGLQKQEDAANGCSLLQRSISLAKDDSSDTLLFDQLDLVHKWLACALCSRESTVGLGPILDVIVEMLSLMQKYNYQMNDVEAIALLPFLIEKAGTAKERFRDGINEILSTVYLKNIYPISKYGPLICLPVIEKTGNSKAKAVAIRELHNCIDVSGLDGIGKKGLISIAKILSEEHVADIKCSLLDLIETVVQKMNSDVQKYIKMCGPNHLSEKARDLILERMCKHGISKGQGDTKQTIDPLSSGLTVSPPYERPASSMKQSTKESVGEIPSLNLTIKPHIDNSASMMRSRNFDSATEIPRNNDGPYTFTFQPKNSLSAVAEEKQRPFTKGSIGFSSVNENHLEPLSTRMHDISTSVTALSTPTENSAAGAAASLRERLKLIRDKHRSVSVSAVTSDTEENISEILHSEPTPIPSSVIIPPQNTERIVKADSLFFSIMDEVDKFLSEPTPLPSNDSRNFSIALDGLRKIHACLTSGSNQNNSLNQTQVDNLRSDVEANLSLCAKKLASILNFGFRCNRTDQSAGLSIPLLSVSLAALMAIFLDVDLSAHVLQDSLVHVLRESCKGLLDPRLNGVLPSASSDLDEATCKKMAKAMNKLAIQAASGTPRHTALQALFSLELEFCANTVRDHISSKDANNINCRISRIIMKLFARIMKEEVEAPDSFNDDRIDLEVIFCSLEDMLNACYNMKETDEAREELDERLNPCINMSRTFMAELIKARITQNRVSTIEEMLVGLHLNTKSSRCWILYSLCCDELYISPTHADAKIPTTNTSSKETNIPSPAAVNRRMQQTKSRPSALEDKVISDLLFAVGSADGELETTRALNNLRKYVSSHSDIDFEPYLKNLSQTFRSYILDSRTEESSVSSLRQRLVAANESSRKTNSHNDSASAVSKDRQTISSSQSVSSAAALRARLESVKKKYMNNNP